MKEDPDLFKIIDQKHITGQDNKYLIKFSISIVIEKEPSQVETHLDVPTL